MPRRLIAAGLLRMAAAMLAACLIAGTAHAAVPMAQCEVLLNEDPDHAHRLAEAMLDSGVIDDVREIQARMCLAMSHVRTGSADRARREIERMKTTLTRDHVPAELTTAALRRAGAVAYAVGDYDRAVEHFVAALDVAESHALIGERIALLVNMGVALGELGEYDRAHRHFEQAQALIERTGERGFEPELLNNFGASLVATGRARQGLALLEQAHALVAGTDNRVGIAQATHSIGNAYRVMGRIDDAEVHLRTALAQRREIGARASEATTRLELARVLRDRGRLRDALAEAEISVRLARETGNEKTEREGHLLLSSLYESAGRLADALAAERRHADMRDAFLQQQNMQRLAEFEMRQRNLLDERELELLRRDNELQALQLQGDRALRNAGGAFIAVLLIVGLMVTAYLRRTNRLLRRSNAIDDLTGLSNRRYLTHLLDWAKHTYGTDARSGDVRENVLFLIDVDKFKSINDRHGHHGGDFALKVLGQRLASACRGDDQVGRWGGEEFLLVTSGMSLAQAAEMAERMRSAVARLPVRLPGGHELRMTASVGFAPWPFFGDGRTVRWQDALRVADRALYSAKSAGRDAWVGLWGECEQGSCDIDAVLVDIGAAEAAGWVRVAASKPPVWKRPVSSQDKARPADAQPPTGLDPAAMPRTRAG